MALSQEQINDYVEGRLGKFQQTRKQRRNRLHRKVQIAREKQPHLSLARVILDGIVEMMDEIVTNSEVKPDAKR